MTISFEDKTVCHVKHQYDTHSCATQDIRLIIGNITRQYDKDK